MQASIILPTYNERDNIANLITSLDGCLAAKGWDAEIVVVDDNSPDGTASVVAGCQKQASLPVRLLVRTKERGLASAIRYGIQQAQGERILVMDTDFNHDPALAPEMLSLLDTYDIVIGSRFVKGGGMEDRQRYYYSWLYNLFLRLLLFQPTRDNLCGFFSMRRAHLMSLDMEAIFRGYGEYFIRLLYIGRCKGYRMIEIPVFYKLRQHGTSKSHFGKMLRDYSACALELRLSRRSWDATPDQKK